MNAVLFADRENPWFHAHDFFRVYSDYVMEQLEELPGIHLTQEPVYLDQLEEKAEITQRADILFSNWGMPNLTLEQIGRYFPSLKALFYAGSTVRQFYAPFFERGVRIFCAGMANAVPASEYTLAQILLANKRCLSAMRAYRDEASYQTARAATSRKTGNYQARVGLIGVGRVGAHVAELLKPFSLSVFAHDPYLPPQRAQQLGITLIELEEIFSTCDVISCHLPDTSQVTDLLGYELFRLMQPYATFINCAQGNCVQEEALIRALQEDPTRVAVLDSLKQEPAPADHPILKLPNAFVSPHIAGSFGDEVERMGETIVEASRHFLSGVHSPHEVTLETRFWIGQ